MFSAKNNNYNIKIISYFDLLLFNNIYYNKCKTLFLLYLNKHIDEIHSNNKYINIRYHHNNYNDYLNEIKKNIILLNQVI